MTKSFCNFIKFRKVSVNSHTKKTLFLKPALQAMRNTELKASRNGALYEVFRKGLSEGSFATMRDAARYVCRQPAPRYYIEAEKASILVGRILHGVSLINLNSCSRRMAWQLYRRYREYLEAHPGCGLSRERVMEILIDEPAPEFYLEAQRVRKILYQERRKAICKWNKRHGYC